MRRSRASGSFTIFQTSTLSSTSIHSWAMPSPNGPSARGAVGGLWRPDTGLAYPSLRTNTSKQKTAFSDLAFDPAVPDHPSRDDVLAYLERYADVTGVRPRIRFGRAVSAVRPSVGGWTVD